MPLTPAQITTLTAELTGAQADPRALGYAPFVSTKDYGSLIALLTWTRDGVTPCPTNNTIGGPTGAITGATNATPIVVTSTGHGLATGDSVVVAGVGGNAAANGTWKITKINNNSFSLDGSVGSGNYTSGGTWQWCVSGVRVGNVTTQQLLGAIDRRDLITNGGASAVTADQYGKMLLFNLIVGDGEVSLVNEDGTDNNNLTNIKQALNNTQASQTRVTALSKRLGSRIEQLLGLSGVVPTETDLKACIG